MSASDTPAFWFAVAAMIGVALAFVLPRLVSRKAPGRGASRAALNADVYRGQLADLDHERASGALAPADYDAARAELQRRLLADATPEERPVTRVSGRVAATTVALLLPLAAIGLYFVFGNPEAIDVSPAKVQASELSAAADPAAFRRQLDAHLAANPGDGRALVSLARLDMAEDRFAEAAAHFAKALEVAPKVARDADVWCEYADALGMTQGGALAGKPTELIGRALSIDARNAKALEMAGSAAYERRDYRMAATYWKDLLAQMPPGTPTYAELATAIQRAERRAALSLPPSAAATPGG
jgi:cytochrome c-type biogenesis protein CcmH